MDSTLHEVFSDENDAATKRRELFIALKDAVSPITLSPYLAVRVKESLGSSLMNEKKPWMSKLPLFVLVATWHLLQHVDKGAFDKPLFLRHGTFVLPTKKNTKSPRTNVELENTKGDVMKITSLAQYESAPFVGKGKNKFGMSLPVDALNLYDTKSTTDTATKTRNDSLKKKIVKLDPTCAISSYMVDVTPRSPSPDVSTNEPSATTSGKSGTSTSKKKAAGKKSSRKKRKSASKSAGSTTTSAKKSRKDGAVAPRALDAALEAVAQAAEPVGVVAIKQRDIDDNLGALQANLSAAMLLVDKLDGVRMNKDGKKTLECLQRALKNGVSNFDRFAGLCSECKVGPTGNKGRDDNTTVTSSSTALPTTKDTIRQRLTQLLAGESRQVGTFNQQILSTAMDWEATKDQSVDDNFSWRKECIDDIFAIKLKTAMDNWYEALINPNEASDVQQDTFNYLHSLESHGWTFNIEVFKNENRRPSNKCDILLVMRHTFWNGGKGPDGGGNDSNNDGDGNDNDANADSTTASSAGKRNAPGPTDEWITTMNKVRDQLVASKEKTPEEWMTMANKAKTAFENKQQMKDIPGMSDWVKDMWIEYKAHRSEPWTTVLNEEQFALLKEMFSKFGTRREMVGMKKHVQLEMRKSPAAKKKSHAAEKDRKAKDIRERKWRTTYDRVVKYVEKQKKKSGSNANSYPKKDEDWVQQQWKEYNKYKVTNGRAGELNKEQFGLIADLMGFTRDAHEESPQKAATPSKTQAAATLSEPMTGESIGSRLINSKKRSPRTPTSSAKEAATREDGPNEDTGNNPQRTSPRKKQKTNRENSE